MGQRLAKLDRDDHAAGGVGTPFDVTYVGPANGPNEYPTFGSYGISIVVEDVGGSRVTLTGTADVTDAVLAGDYNTLPAVGNPNLVEGQSTGTVLLAVITDPNTLATAADLTATVDWGDSESGPATVVQDGSTSGGTVFDIYGSHVYQEEGTYDFTLDVTSVGGASTSFSTDNGVATVLDAPLTGSAGTESPESREARRAPSCSGTFIDANQASTVADYTTRARLGRRQLGRRLGATNPGRRQPHRHRHAQRRRLDHQRRPHLHRGGDLRLHGHGDR